MQRKTGIKVMLLVGLLGIALALAACTSGVAQKEYDAVKQQLATKEQEVASLQQRLGSGEGTGTGPAATALREQLAAKEQELAKAKQDLQAAQAGGQQATQLQQQLAAKDADVKKAQDQVTAKEKEIADLKLSLGKAPERNPVIWTKLLPTPAPRPTATPAPPGYVAPTPVPPPAELVNEVVPFTFYVETLTGHQVTTVAQYPSCVPNSQFRRGAHLVWRFEVFDTSTGKRVTGLDTDATIKVVLPHGEEKISRYSKRGGSGPWMWSAGFTIPLDYPLGTFDYQIVVTKGGRTGTFDQDKVALVRAATATAAGIDSRVQIVE